MSLSLPDVGEDMPVNCCDTTNQSILISEVSAPQKPHMDVIETYKHEGSASMLSDMSDPTSIKILRDSGTSQSFAVE